MLRASGNPSDSLEMVLTIRSEGRELYRDSWIVDRVIGFDAGRRVASDAEWESVRRFYGEEFFAASKLETPRAFLTEIRRDLDEIPWGVEMSPEEWSVLVRSDLPSFRYSPGGDRVIALAWNPASETFVDFLQCC